LEEQSSDESENMNNKDLTDFLLEEYKNIAQAYFNSHEVTAKWIKFYLILMATPFSFVLFVYKQSPNAFDYMTLPNIISVYTTLIGLLGILMSFIIINSRLDSTLYARSVNGIRCYFKNAEKLKGQDNIDQYFVLPDDVNKPKFLKYGGDLSVLTAFMAMINSLYISMGMPQVDNIKRLYVKCLSQNTISVVIFIAILLIHGWIYYSNASKKEDCYKKQIIRPTAN